MRSSSILAVFVPSLASALSRGEHRWVSGDPQSRNSTNPGHRRCGPVDLGYGIYQGIFNETTALNVFKSIRYADPPTHQYRWQPPRSPTTSGTGLIQASTYANRCPQSPDSPYRLSPCPDLETAATLPTACATSTTFRQVILGNEDCLFLSVFAPRSRTKLPVFVWIHGGGYGQGDGTQDLTTLINANNNGFVGVAIQYRLGAFGWLASEDVHRNGIVNAGLLDQHFALQWVQKYISKFGGDPRRVTIAGESAGAGAVMLHDMAYGGCIGSELFQNEFQSIVASPYLATQNGYADAAPTQAYDAFAAEVGCHGNATQTTWDCLVSKDSLVLQQASAIISGGTKYGTWNFLPVTDGTYIQELPSIQLQQKRVNGRNILSGNNANEGIAFTPQNIVTPADLLAYLRTTLPYLTNSDIDRILNVYAIPNTPTDPSAPLYATNGLAPPTQLNQPSFATGQQQLANLIYGESTFVCPSYWLASAYTPTPGADGAANRAYKYQYSPVPAEHDADIAGYFGPRPPFLGPDFSAAFMRIWGNFIMTSNPSIDALTVNGLSTGNRTATAASNWPIWSEGTGAQQLNMNQTGGVPTLTPFTIVPLLVDGVLVEQADILAPGRVYDVNAPAEQQFRNDFGVVDAWSWEGGRGERCEMWRELGARVPE